MRGTTEFRSVAGQSGGSAVQGHPGEHDQEQQVPDDAADRVWRRCRAGRVHLGVAAAPPASRRIADSLGTRRSGDCHPRGGTGPPHNTGGAVEFRILGSLAVTEAGTVTPVGGARLRSVLAYLLLHVGQPVSVAALIDEVWGESPPRTATNTLQTYVSCCAAGRRATPRADRCPRCPAGTC
jgi:hypothetical protein